MAENEIGAGLECGLRHGPLIIGDHARHKMDAPMQRQHNGVRPLLGRAHIGHQVCQILLVGRGNNPRRYAGLIIDRFETCGGAHRGHR